VFEAAGDVLVTPAIEKAVHVAAFFIWIES
jgi:hypothetical protein